MTSTTSRWRVSILDSVPSVAFVTQSAPAAEVTPAGVFPTGTSANNFPFPASSIATEFAATLLDLPDEWIARYAPAAVTSRIIARTQIAITERRLRRARGRSAALRKACGGPPLAVDTRM